jgi:hypothetical protein
MEEALGSAGIDSASGLVIVEVGEYEVGTCSLTMPVGSERLGPEELSPMKAGKKEVVSVHTHQGESHGLNSSRPRSTQIQVYQRSCGRSSRFSQVWGDSVLGVFPRLTTKGVMGSAQIVSSVSKGESASSSDSFSLIGSRVVSSDMERFRDSLQVDEELNFVMETGGVAGLYCEG